MVDEQYTFCYSQVRNAADNLLKQKIHEKIVISHDCDKASNFLN